MGSPAANGPSTAGERFSGQQLQTLPQADTSVAGRVDLCTLKTALLILQRSDQDTTVLEGIIDCLLSDIIAEDTFSLSMHHYMHFMHLLQWAIQCVWLLHSRDALMLAATTAASQTASGFTRALQLYVKAVHADLNTVARNDLSTTSPVSEPLRIKLRSVKKMADSAWMKLQASHSEEQFPDTWIKTMPCPCLVCLPVSWLHSSFVHNFRWRHGCGCIIC